MKCSLSSVSTQDDDDSDFYFNFLFVFNFKAIQGIYITHALLIAFIYMYLCIKYWLRVLMCGLSVVCPCPECSLSEEDMLVLELLQWFKGHFFSWVDSLPCSRCGGKTQSAGSLPPSEDDLRWDAGRVENHFCNACQLSTRFPRYGTLACVTTDNSKVVGSVP